MPPKRPLVPRLIFPLSSVARTTLLAAAGLNAPLLSSALAQGTDEGLQSLELIPQDEPSHYEFRFEERLGLSEEGMILELLYSEDLTTWDKLDLNRLRSEGFEILSSSIEAKSDAQGPILDRTYLVSKNLYTAGYFHLQLRELTEEVSFELIRLDEALYPGLIQSWDSIGMDDEENIYFGFTTEVSEGIEDTNVFKYHQASGTYEHLGSYIGALTAAGNYLEGESVPKGHTHMPFVKGKLYTGSQSFHDFKDALYEPDHNLNDMRGSHLFSIDAQSGALEDLSVHYPGGVATANEGILALSLVPYGDHLFGLTHPFGDIVFLNHTTGAIDKVVPGIPWSLGNPISREMVVTPNGHIYIYRGTEKPENRHLSFNIYKYDIAADELTMVDFQCKGGFWDGQTVSKDQNDAYIVTVQGELYHLDMRTETWSHLGNMLPLVYTNDGGYIRNIYGITLDLEEENIYGIITREEGGASSGDLIEFNLATQTSRILENFGPGIYTGNNLRDSKGNIYFNRFGDTYAWREDCGLLKIHFRREP